MSAQVVFQAVAISSISFSALTGIARCLAVRRLTFMRPEPVAKDLRSLGRTEADIISVVAIITSAFSVFPSGLPNRIAWRLGASVRLRSALWQLLAMNPVPLVAGPWCAPGAVEQVGAYSLVVRPGLHADRLNT